MPSLEALTLTGRSSKCSSRGSDGRTRRGFAILARRLRRSSAYLVVVDSAMPVPEDELGTSIIAAKIMKRQGVALNLILDEHDVTESRQGGYCDRESAEKRYRMAEGTHAESIPCDPPEGY